jgi:signal transduction histidine kinase
VTSRSSAPYRPLVIGVALLALLALLATLQWRWIGQVNELQSQRMRGNLLSEASGFSADFDREVTRAFLYFHPDHWDPGGAWQDRLVRQSGRWASAAPYPRLVRDVLHVHRAATSGELSLEILRPGAQRFQPVSWPAELQPLRSRLDGRAGVPFFGQAVSLTPDLPALLMPFPRRPPPAPPGAQATPAPEPELRRKVIREADFLVVVLDPKTIREEILPSLTRKHFGSPQGMDHAVAVVDAGDPARILFRSDSSLPAGLFRKGDARVPIFGLRPFDDLRSLWNSHRGERGPGLDPSSPPPSPAPAVHNRGEAWELVVKRRDGSLEGAVARIRHHNLAVSAGILALLAFTTGLMIVTTQRAQRLARQQMEFVAAVSHELHTPLTAIRSAGQNLAAGVVADPAQVKRYGGLIESEGRRLSGMVGQVLDFAGIQSGRQAYNLQPTEVAPVVEGALADSRWMLEERQARMETEIAPGLPPVLGDSAALRRALRNLIENAAKYGAQPGSPPWIGVRALAVDGEVRITVEDHGIGLHREDIPNLFEPFYRGRGALERSIAGSGLGLSVVGHIARAHRGRVTVDSDGDGRGSAFTLHLPVAPEERA